MNCQNCGKKLDPKATACPHCGTPASADPQPNPPQQNNSAKIQSIAIIVILLVLIAAAIVGIIFAVRSSDNKGSDTTPAPAPSSAAATAAVAPSAAVKPTQSTTPASSEMPEVSDKLIATEPPFTISQSDLEKEIEKIRTYYYTPSSDDEKIVLENGTNGWNYSRDYRYHNGRLIFAFIFDGTEEHRLYFKDDHMIRYIDENSVTYDFPDCNKYSSWAEKALKEAYAQYGGSSSDASSGWLGTWSNGSGESFEITSVTDDRVKVIHHHLNEQGDRQLDTPYSMVYTDSSKRSVTEDSDGASWVYTLTLYDDYLLVQSRYPDQKFYKEP